MLLLPLMLLLQQLLLPILPIRIVIANTIIVTVNSYIGYKKSILLLRLLPLPRLWLGLLLESSCAFVLSLDLIHVPLADVVDSGWPAFRILGLLAEERKHT